MRTPEEHRNTNSGIESSFGVRFMMGQGLWGSKYLEYIPFLAADISLSFRVSELLLLNTNLIPPVDVPGFINLNLSSRSLPYY